MRPSWTLLAAALLSTGALGAPPLRLKGADVAKALEQGLEGLVIHLDYDVAGADGKAVPRSFVELPARLGGERTFFSMPEQAISLGSFGQATYRVRDINLERLTVAAEGGEYVLRLFFEDQGYELVAAGRSAGLAPDVQLDRMCLSLHLTPKQGAAEVEKGTVTFDANTKVAGLEASALLDDVTGYNAYVKALIEREAAQAIASQGLLRALNDRLKQELTSRGADAGALRFEGTDLVVKTGGGERPGTKRR